MKRVLFGSLFILSFHLNQVCSRVLILQKMSQFIVSKHPAVIQRRYLKSPLFFENCLTDHFAKEIITLLVLASYSVGLASNIHPLWKMPFLSDSWLLTKTMLCMIWQMETYIHVQISRFFFCCQERFPLILLSLYSSDIIALMFTAWYCIPSQAIVSWFSTKYMHDQFNFLILNSSKDSFWTGTVKQSSCLDLSVVQKQEVPTDPAGLCLK